MSSFPHYNTVSSSFSRFHQFRTTDKVRDKYAETLLEPSDFVLPCFVVEGRGIKSEIPTLRDVYRFSPDKLLNEIDSAYKLGIDKVLLFGVIDNHRKDETGSFSWSKNNPVNILIPIIKRKFPAITVITDICLCSYTIHGHCGIPEEKEINNDASLPLLAQMALSHAEAGADIVAPSSMMDGQVWAIRSNLDKNGISDTKILAYSAKYSSSLYGPFRDAANSSPAFGDRKTYQMDYRVSEQAIEEIRADLNEGADYIMIKPAHTYLDIINKAKASFPETTIAAYHVSGEYMMIKAAAESGFINETQAALEIHTAIKRAGAKWIISYYSAQLAKTSKKTA